MHSKVNSKKTFVFVALLSHKSRTVFVWGFNKVSLEFLKEFQEMFDFEPNEPIRGKCFSF
jgi:hypothetical protein